MMLRELLCLLLTTNLFLWAGAAECSENDGTTLLQLGRESQAREDPAGMVWGMATDIAKNEVKWVKDGTTPITKVPEVPVPKDANASKSLSQTSIRKDLLSAGSPCEPASKDSGGTCQANLQCMCLAPHRGLHVCMDREMMS